jgi:hypothetical protein
LGAAAKLADQFEGQEAFDRSALEGAYKASQELAMFMAHHGGFTLKDPPHVIAKKGAPAHLLALAALLLFRTGQDQRAAAQLYTRLTQGPPASDQRRGNIIGLDPFHDFDAWRLVRLAADLVVDPSWSFDQYRDVQTTEARMRAEHAAWVAAGRP